MVIVIVKYVTSRQRLDQSVLCGITLWIGSAIQSVHIVHMHTSLVPKCLYNGLFSSYLAKISSPPEDSAKLQAVCFRSQRVKRIILCGPHKYTVGIFQVPE